MLKAKPFENNEATGMKSKRILILLLLAGTIMFGSGWTNALKPKGEPVEIDLRNFSSVVTSAHPDAREEFAARQLIDLLRKMTGVNLTLASPTDAIKGRAIQFGPIDPDLGDSGYRIAVKDNNLILSGGTRRGVINAVIALLEEDLGVRWYAPQEPPRLPLLTPNIEIVPRSYTPELVSRAPFYVNAFDSDWEIFNRTNQTSVTRVPESLGGAFHFPRTAFCHTFHQFLPPSLFETHPEYFALINGKRTVNKPGSHAAHLCMTDPDVPGIVAKNAIDLLRRQNPSCDIISISQNDGRGGFCRCEKCLAFIKSNGEVSDLLLHFVNRVAALIGKEYPDMKVETLAYLESAAPPRTVRPARNVYIRLCTAAHAWNYPLFYVEESAEFYPTLKGWHEIGADLLIWDYVVDFNNYPMPIPNLWVMDHNFDVYLANGARGVMLQGDYQSPGGADVYLKSWIFAKRMWNPQWKLDALLDDFIDGYYGDAAPSLHQYYALQKAEWQKFHDRYQGKKLGKSGPKFSWSRSFIDQSRKLLDDALKTAQGNQELAKRIKRIEFNWLYMRLSAGPRANDDVEAFRHDIDKFGELAKEFKVTRCHESGAASGQIDDKIKEFECTIADTLLRKCSEGGFRFCAHNCRIWKTGNTASRVKDGLRIQLAQKGGTPGWSMQWRFNEGSYAPGVTTGKFVPGQRYQLLVCCRVEVNPGEENYFKVAIYDPPTKKLYGQITAKSSDFKNDKLVTLKSEPFIPRETSVLYVSPLPGKLLKALYIDHILMVPVK